MANSVEYIADCPRCGTKQTTFDWLAENRLNQSDGSRLLQTEAFCVCRSCRRATVFKLRAESAHKNFALRGMPFGQFSGNMTAAYDMTGHLNVGDFVAEQPPEHLPSEVEAAFREGALCSAIGCPNAAGAMLRLALDLASKNLLRAVPATATQPNAHQRKELKARLEYLINQHLLPAALHDLVDCIRDDGNTAAHEGKVTEDEAADMLDLSIQVLNRVYSEPGRLEAIKSRQAARKAAAKV